MAVTVMRTEMVHESGTKRYAVLGAYDQASSKGFLLTNWGKTGAVGQVKIHWATGSWAAMRRYYDNSISVKENRGYKVVEANTVVAYDSSSLVEYEKIRKILFDLTMRGKDSEARRWMTDVVRKHGTGAGADDTIHVAASSPPKIDMSSVANWGDW